MKYIMPILIILILSIVVISLAVIMSLEPGLPVFIENSGEFSEEVLFSTKVRDAMYFFYENKVVIDFRSNVLSWEFQNAHDDVEIKSVGNNENIIYEDLYSGIDVVFSTYEEGLVYSIVVSPGADPGMIEYKYGGAESLLVNSKKELEVYMPGWLFTDSRPAAYQEISGRVEVPIEYSISEGIVSYEVGEYDADYPLIIET